MPMTEEGKAKFCELLKDAVKDEEKATEMYRNLIASVGTPEYIDVELTIPREVLIAINRQEDDHRRILEVIRAYHCPIKSE